MFASEPSGWEAYPNANIKFVAHAVSLVCLDSTLSFFFMTSVMTILFSVAERSNTLRYIAAEGKAMSSLRHLMVVRSHPYCSCMSMPHSHVCCFYEHVRPSWVVDAGDVAHECTMPTFLHHHRIESFRVMNVELTQHSVLSCDNQQHVNKEAWLLQPRDEEPSSLHVLHGRSSSLWWLSWQYCMYLPLTSRGNERITGISYNSAEAILDLFFWRLGGAWSP